MAVTTVASRPALRVSEMAENLIGSEIIKLATEIKEKIRSGERIFNYTIGDFDPSIFPIPAELNAAIQQAYRDNHTNYPAANGIVDLRNALSVYIKERAGLEYSPDELLVSGGARPLIYGTFATVVDPGDKVIVPLPSWNNNHYCHLFGATPVYVTTTPESNFMPAAADLKPHLRDATLVALCSPLNPTGTVFRKKQLEDICDLILEENRRRDENEKPLYLMYDQIYWLLTFGETEHYDPVTLRPEMRDYTVYIDGISKCFAATGVRVGWSYGPKKLIDKMRAILSHVGAWAPRAEQVATAHYLRNKPAVDNFLRSFKKEINERLTGFYQGFSELKKDGFRVDSIAPQAAMYLTVRLELEGMQTPNGTKLETQSDVTNYILNEASLALVPFNAFGSSGDSPWYRLSVGTCSISEIPEVFAKLRKVLSQLK